MADPVPPRSALAGAARFDGAGAALALAERTGSTLLHLEGARPGAALDAVLTALGLAEPPPLGNSGGRDGAWLLGLGPGIRLLALEQRATLPAALTLAGAAGLAFEAALDISHAYTRIEIAGGKAGELIAKGCALDLHPRRFPAGACAAAGFAGMRTIVWRAPDRDGFDLFVGRSHAVSLWEWLIEAATEYRENAGAAAIVG